MPKSRGRKSKKAKRPAGRAHNPAGRAPSAGRFTTAVGGVTWKRAMSVLDNPNLPPDALIAILVPTLWTGVMAGRQANVCVDACRMLQHAYGQFGMRSELRAVELEVVDGRGEVIHHAPQPSWEGNVLSGHCIVCLPDDHRFIDATVEQYRRVAHLRFGVVVGRAAELAGGDAEQRAAIGNGRLPAGARMVMQRQSLTLDYLLADDAATAVILGHPSVRDNVEAHRRAGINLASLSLEGLRRSGSADRARAAPYPRLHALLDAIGDDPVEVDEAGDWYFKLAGDDGTVRRLRLDEIPLPETAPPAAGEEGPIDASSAPVSDTLRVVTGWRPWPRGSADNVDESESDSAGLRLRLARPGESGDVDRLLRLAGVELTPRLADAIEDGSVSSALLRAAASGQEELLRVLKAAVDSGDPTAATADFSTILVAEAPDRALVGAALALPPLDLSLGPPTPISHSSGPWWVPRRS